MARMGHGWDGCREAATVVPLGVEANQAALRDTVPGS